MSGRCLRRFMVEVDGAGGMIRRPFRAFDETDLRARFATETRGPARRIVSVVEETDPCPPKGIVRPVLP